MIKFAMAQFFAHASVICEITFEPSYDTLMSVPESELIEGLGCALRKIRIGKIIQPCDMIELALRDP
jgi:hypothetical protein